jgi:hypothetical protein
LNLVEPRSLVHELHDADQRQRQTEIQKKGVPKPSRRKSRIKTKQFKVNSVYMIYSKRRRYKLNRWGTPLCEPPEIFASKTDGSEAKDSV